MQPGPPLSDRVRLLAGPWYHVSDFGGLHLHALQLRWFDYWLKDDTEAAISAAPLTFQAIGSPRWFHADHYPLAQATPTHFYLSHLVPTRPARRALAGGRYRVHQGGPTPSQLVVSLADPDVVS
jgi:predicted acyl esterase